MELIKAASFTLHSPSYRFEVYSILCSSIQLARIALTLASMQKGCAATPSSSQNCPIQREYLIYIHHSYPALLHLHGNLKKKRNLMDSATLPSDNMPQGTGWIQTHSSCTFSCKLLGLHLSGSRNEQVSPVAHQSSKVPAAGTLREASCFQISVAPTQPSHKETEGRAQRQLKNHHPADSASK